MRGHLLTHLGRDVLINGVSRRVIWTVREAAPTLGGIAQGIAEPVMVMPPDVPAVTPGTAVVHDDVTYVVADVMPRTDGWSDAILRRT